MNYLRLITNSKSETFDEPEVPEPLNEIDYKVRS